MSHSGAAEDSRPLGREDVSRGECLPTFQRSVMPWRWIQQIFRNVGKHWPSDTSSHPRRHEI